MRTIYLLANIFFLVSSYIIRDLPFNTYHIENMDKYDNKLLSEGTEFFIRFPLNSENEMIFYLIIPKNITLFPLYISEFSEYPDETEIKNTNFNHLISSADKDEEETQYFKYSFNIITTLPYQVIYFKNTEKIGYIAFYAYSSAENIFSNIPMNQGFSIYSLKSEYSYYLKFNISDPDEKTLKIETSADSSSNYAPNYELDIKCFSYIPSEYEITRVDYTWRRKLSYKYGDDALSEERIYEYEPDKNSKFCAIRIYNKIALDELHIHLEMTEKVKLPIWATILIVILAILVIIGIIYCLRKCCQRVTAPENADNTKAAAACCLAGCLCAWCLATVADSGRY